MASTIEPLRPPEIFIELKNKNTCKSILFKFI